MAHPYFSRAMSYSRQTLTTHVSAGTVTGVSVTLPACTIKVVEFIPNTGATQPTNLFDATLLDADSLDLLGGGGADLVNTGPTLIEVDIPFPGGAVAPTIANAGNSKTIELVLGVEVW